MRDWLKRAELYEVVTYVAFDWMMVFFLVGFIAAFAFGPFSKPIIILLLILLPVAEVAALIGWVFVRKEEGEQYE